MHPSRATPDPLRHILGSLHVEGLDVNHPAGHFPVHRDLLPHLDLRHLAVGVLEDELLALRVEQGREQPAVRALAARARQEVAEADVVRDPRTHALDAGVEHLHVLVDLPGHDRGRRLVELDVVRTRLDERAQLGVDGGDEVPAEGEPVVAVHVAGAELDVDRERDGSRTGRLHGLVGLGLQIPELIDDAEPFRHLDAMTRPVARRRVVGVQPGLPERLDRVEAVHFLVEGLHEEEASHLAVTDDVDARALLIADGELGCVVEGFLHVGLAVLARFDPVERGPEPAGEAVASHHMRRDRGQRGRHAQFFIRGADAWQWRRGPARRPPWPGRRSGTDSTLRGSAQAQTAGIVSTKAILGARYHAL